MKTAFLLITAGLLAGCASTKQFVEIPTSARINQNTARISLERIQEIGSSAVSFAVLDDGMLVGDIAVGGKLLWDRPVGESCLIIRGGAFLTDNRLCFKAVGGEVNEVRFSGNHGLYVLKLEQQLQNKTIINSN